PLGGAKGDLQRERDVVCLSRATDGIRDKLVTGVRRVRFRSQRAEPIRGRAREGGVGVGQSAGGRAGAGGTPSAETPVGETRDERSEERRVGKECRRGWRQCR